MHLKVLTLGIFLQFSPFITETKANQPNQNAQAKDFLDERGEI